MKTSSNTSCDALLTAEAGETLGWNAMPAYGEILPRLTAESRALPSHFLSLGKSASTAPAQTFWSMVANSK